MTLRTDLSRFLGKVGRLVSANSVRSPRIARERKTLVATVRLYCRHHHGGGALCAECRDLLAYSLARLEGCPFQEGKTTCAKCPVHCYRPAMRERIKAVMRYAGPRMLYRHPLLAVLHLMDGLRKQPSKPG